MANGTSERDGGRREADVSHPNRRRSLYFALLLCLSARLLGLALGWLLWDLGLVPTHPTAPDQVYLDVPLEASWTLGVWQRLDAVYYLQIAMYGYKAEDGTVVFLPLYPLLVRAAGGVLDGQYLLAALLISSLACVGSLALLYEVTAEELGIEAAGRAIVYQALFPTAYVLIAPYAEPLTLLLILLTFRWARRERWWLAGLAAFAATLTRTRAVVLAIPLAYFHFRRFGFSARALRPELMVVAAPLVAVTAYNLYLVQRGLPWVVEEYTHHWFSKPAIPGTDLWIALRKLGAGELNFQRSLALGLTLLFIGLTVVALKRLPLQYGLFMTGYLLYALSRHEMADRPLLSMSRHVLLLFPGFMLLGKWGRHPWIHRLILYPSFALYLFLMGVFFMWGYAE